jgi:hypothetical protein
MLLSQSNTTTENGPRTATAADIWPSSRILWISNTHLAQASQVTLHHMVVSPPPRIVLGLVVVPHADPTTGFTNVTVLCQMPEHVSYFSAQSERQWLRSRLRIPHECHGQVDRKCAAKLMLRPRSDLWTLQPQQYVHSSCPTAPVCVEHVEGLGTTAA